MWLPAIRDIILNQTIYIYIYIYIYMREKNGSES